MQYISSVGHRNSYSCTGSNILPDGLQQQFHTPSSPIIPLSGFIYPVVDYRGYTGSAKCGWPVKADLAICSFINGVSG